MPSPTQTLLRRPPRQRAAKAEVESSSSVHLSELQIFLNSQKEILKDSLLYLEKETMDDVFSLGYLLSQTEMMLKKIDTDIKKKSNT